MRSLAVSHLHVSMHVKLLSHVPKRKARNPVPFLPQYRRFAYDAQKEYQCTYRIRSGLRTLRIYLVKTMYVYKKKRKPLSLSLWVKFSHAFSPPGARRGASNCQVFSSNHHLVSRAKPSLVRPFARGSPKWVALYLTLVLRFCTHLLVRCKKQAVSHVLGMRNIWSRATTDLLLRNIEWCETEILVRSGQTIWNLFLKDENANYTVWKCWLSWL